MVCTTTVANWSVDSFCRFLGSRSLGMENKNEQNTSCHAVKRACASQVFHAKRLDFKVCLACSNYLSLICLTPWRQPARRMHSDKPPVARILQTASEFRHAASRCHALKGFVSGQRYPTPRPDGSIQRIMSHELSVSPPSNLWVAALSASPLCQHSEVEGVLA